MKAIPRWIILLTIFAMLLFPIYLMVMNSLSPVRGFLRNPPRLLPYAWTLDNYRRALSLPMLARWIANTAILVGIIVPLGVVINGAAAYAFCFAKMRWLQVVFWLFMTPIFVTRYVLLISQIRIVSIVGLGGLLAVASMSLFWASGIFLFRNYFRAIPHEIMESARMDGAGEWRTLMQVVLPMSLPMVGMAIVFLGMAALGDYVWQMLNLQTMSSRTYLVGLMATTIDVTAAKNIGYDLTIGTLTFLPYLILFAFSSRYFIGGITGGAVKE